VPRSEIIIDPDLQRTREEAKAKQIEVDERDLLRPLKAKHCPDPGLRRDMAHSPGMHRKFGAGDLEPA